MQKNSLHLKLFNSSEHLVVKRLIWLVDSEKGKNQIIEKAKGELAIEDFLGKKPEEAEQDIEKKIKVSKEEIDQMMKNWSWSGQWIPSTWKLDASNLNNMEKDLQRLAEDRVKLKATQLQLDEDMIEKHAKGSIMVLKAKREVLREFMGDLDKNLKEKEKQLQAVQKANEALGFLKKAYWGIRNSDLEKEIKNLKQMKARAEKVQGRVEGKSTNKKESLSKISDLDGRLRSIILSHDEKVAGDLDRVIRGELVDSQDGYEGGLEKFFEDHPDLGLSDLEKDTCRKILKYLKDGSTRANWTGSRLGTFSKSDVEAFYLDKYLDRGALNKESDKVKDRVERLKNLPLGQQVLINKRRFSVIRKPSGKYNGFIIKSEQRVGFIDVSNPEKPILTVQKPDGSYVSWNLSAQKNETPSLTAVEFNAKKIELGKPESQSTPTSTPNPTPPPTSTPTPTSTDPSAPAPTSTPNP